MTPEAAIIESMFKIVDKEKNEVPFHLNPAQRKIDNDLTGRDIIPKARQEGVSSFFLARYTVKCLSQRNTQAVIISHESESTQRLLSRCQFFLNNFRGPAPDVGRDSLNIITFPKMNSKMYIGTAGSRKFGRGDTITNLHCSELAYWPDPKQLLGGLLQSVPMSGEIAIESTGNGVGNYYHRMTMRAAEGRNQWKCHFLDWNSFPEYTLNLTSEDDEALVRELHGMKVRVEDGLMEDEYEEVRMFFDVGLTPGQIAWRRMKLDEMDYDLRVFKQEYPISLDECFQASGDSIFRKVLFTSTDRWKDQGDHLHVLDPHPIQGHIYVVGADPSGGTGGDNACAQVIDITLMEQVAEYAHNKTEPDVFGNKVADLAKIFNHAYIVVESNNHGPITIQSIRDADYPSYLLYSMDYAPTAFEDKTLMQMGFRTNTRTKPIMVGRLRSALSHNLRIHSEMLNGELSTFIEHPDGKMSAADGCHDDRVMALACANMGIERAALYAAPEVRRASVSSSLGDPFALDAIIDEMQGKRSAFPIPPQNSWGEGGY